MECFVLDCFTSSDKIWKIPRSLVFSTCGGYSLFPTASDGDLRAWFQPKDQTRLGFTNNVLIIQEVQLIN